MIEQFHVDGITQVVGADKLVELTSQGWRLVAVLQSTVEFKGGQRSEYVNGQQQILSNSDHSTSAFSFLVTLDKESSLAKLSKDLEQARADESSARQGLDAAVKDLERSQSNGREQEGRAEALSQTLAKKNQEVERMRSTIQKMEGDLAAVRSAIGDIRYVEITKIKTAVLVSDCASEPSKPKAFY